MKKELPLAVIAWLVIAIITAAVGLSKGGASVNQDFAYFYQSGRSLWGQAEPSALNLAPPAMILLLSPVTLLALRTAQFVWNLLGLVALGIAVWQVQRSTGMSWLILMAATLATAASLVELLMGQVSFVLLLPLTLAWIADRRQNQRTAGLWFGIVLYAKPFLGLFLIDWLLRGSWRTVAWVTLSVGLCVTVGLFPAGPVAYLHWLDALRHVVWQGNPLNASLSGLITRTLSTSPNSVPATPITVVKDVRPFVFLTLIGVCATSAWRLRTVDRDHAWAILLTTCLLVSPLGWVYYFPLLVGPLAARWCTSSAGTHRLLTFGVALACVPPPTFARHYNAFATATWGSVYSWSLLILWAATLMSSESYHDRSEEPDVAMQPWQRRIYRRASLDRAGRKSAVCVAWPHTPLLSRETVKTAQRSIGSVRVLF